MSSPSASVGTQSMGDSTEEREAARTALLRAIAENAQALNRNQGQTSTAVALKELAEAFAWVVSPGNAH
ncbi:hypothetical protein [Wenjunlia tyrosinilytica]|uniref:Uncharacterized protein n=1 Tax=Wenjunlia tyrosinilytica TaxID=1544741 RepID=A0A917ZSK7_9ACTN|nr:hypothetical protein [Wenjunlia tyrosinilytica]GGO90572.1 hypothetical protein GCM10012280_36400 [Wenjunlia tyrosinilytica]